HVQIESVQLNRPLYVNHGVSEPLGMEVHGSIRPVRSRVHRVQPSLEFRWRHGMVSHIAWMGSAARYLLRLDSGMQVEASVSRLAMAQNDAPAVGEEVYIDWSGDSATVLTS